METPSWSPEFTILDSELDYYVATYYEFVKPCHSQIKESYILRPKTTTADTQFSEVLKQW